MPQKNMESFRLLLEHLAWIEHQYLSGIRDSRKAWSLWGMMRGVVGVRKTRDQSWLAKQLGLGLLCWGFKGVQEEIPPEEASTLEIGSGAFPPGQCTSSQIHPCHRLFDQNGNQDSSSPSPLSGPWSLWLGYSQSSRKNLEAVVMRELWRWKRLWRRSLTRSHKRTFMGPSRSCCTQVHFCTQVHCSRKRLFLRELEFHVCTIKKSAHTKKSRNLFNDPRRIVWSFK